MPSYHVQVTLAAITGETADSQVNTFAFSSGSPGLASGGADTITGFLKTFYDSLASANALNGIAQNGHTVKFYNAVTTVPNYPLFTRTFNREDLGYTIDLPEEVALCISFANDSEVTVPARRRRGRIYVSGWAETTNTVGRPTSTAISAAVGAYVALANAINGMVDVTMCVWSRSNGALYPIERVWVDNEWDTMRSRGGKSTARTTTLVTP